MTIYAIVNGLISKQSENSASTPVWTLISPSAILQGGNPYFVPDFDTRFEARPALALRIGKLGKGIARRFAHRYIDSVTPCCAMVATDTLRSAMESGLPWSRALSYDRSIVMGTPLKIPMEEIGEFRFNVTLQSAVSTPSCEWTAAECASAIEDVVSELSRDNTLKTGDIILIGMAPEGPLLCEGQRAVISVGSDVSARFNIR